MLLLAFALLLREKGVYLATEKYVDNKVDGMVINCTDVEYRYKSLNFRIEGLNVYVLDSVERDFLKEEGKGFCLKGKVVESQQEIDSCFTYCNYGSGEKDLSCYNNASNQISSNQIYIYGKDVGGKIEIDYFIYHKKISLDSLLLYGVPYKDDGRVYTADKTKQVIKGELVDYAKSADVDLKLSSYAADLAAKFDSSKIIPSGKKDTTADDEHVYSALAAKEIFADAAAAAPKSTFTYTSSSFDYGIRDKFVCVSLVVIDSSSNRLDDFVFHGIIKADSSNQASFAIAGDVSLKVNLGEQSTNFLLDKSGYAISDFEILINT